MPKKSTAPLRAAIYARYSTDKQDRTTSIGAQVDNCTMLAERDGFEIAKKHIFQDHALSGAKVDRPGYTALKQAIANKEIDVVLANETSRLTRVTSELIALGELLQQHRPKLHLVTCDGIDTRADGWEWLLLIKAGVDSQERRKCAFRTYGGLRRRVKQGNSAGGKSYGYTHKQDGEYRTKVIMPVQAAVALRIFEMYADGMSHRQIAHTLNDEGVPSPGANWKRSNNSGDRKRTDGKWMGSTIYSLLRNPLYRGEDIWNRGEWYMYTDHDTGKTTRKRNQRPEEEWMRRYDETLRIVSPELWKRCEARMQETKARTSRQKYKGGRRRQRLFDLRCAECNGAFVMINGRSLGCSTYRNGGESACDNSALVRLSVVNEVLIKELCEMENGLLSEKTLAEVRKHMVRHVRRLKAQAAKDSGESHTLHTQITEIDAKMERIADGIESHGYSDVLARRLRKLEKEQRGLEAQLAATTDGRLDSLPDIVPDALLRYREEIRALADVKNGLSVQDLARARSLIGEVLGPVRIDRSQVAHLALAESVVAGVGFEPTTFGL